MRVYHDPNTQMPNLPHPKIQSKTQPPPITIISSSVMKSTTFPGEIQSEIDLMLPVGSDSLAVISISNIFAFNLPKFRTRDIIV